MWILKFKPVDCKNCYKCVRNCPVKAIRVKDHQAQIMEDACILCEKCTIVCPQHAKEEKNDIPSLKRMIADGRKLVASVNPAYIAKYGPGSFPALRQALMGLGFSDAREAAEGTCLVKSQYEKILEEEKRDVMITSICPSVVRLIRSKYPELIEYLLPVLSPMQAHAKYLREKSRDCIPVYISPCISPVAELREKINYSAYVVSFDELDAWLEEKQIVIENCPEPKDFRLSRMQAVNEGITYMLRKNPAYSYLSIDGVENCMKVLDELKEGKIHKCFLELNACEGGCIGGPSFQNTKFSRIQGELDVRKASAADWLHPDPDADFEIEEKIGLEREFIDKTVEETCPTEEELQAILNKMGKTSRAKELNCGACGYNTCREKAVAIFQNKAEVSMCIPYMREREASYANKIINSMPGMLVTVNTELKVIQLNKAAMDLFDIRRKKSIIGQPVSKLMDDYAFVNMLSYGKNFTQDQIFVEEYKVYLDRVLTYDKNNGLIICIMKNVTKEIVQKQEVQRTRIMAAKMADKLADEQLRIVHQIAELLGETAADTKVAVENLKETILAEQKEPEKERPEVWL
ncbi:MAG: [Fe-Fe] hydrogenase large subunit C-terminal domain-containing protein [Blautia sp.]